MPDPTPTGAAEPALPVPSWTPMRQTAGYAYDDDNLRDYAARWALHASATIRAERDELRVKLEAAKSIGDGFEQALYLAVAERDRLRAELEVIRAAKPVGEVLTTTKLMAGGGTRVTAVLNRLLHAGTPLYAGPVAAAGPEEPTNCPCRG